MNTPDSLPQSFPRKIAKVLLHPLVVSSVAVAGIAAFQAERISDKVTEALFPAAPAPVTEVKALLVSEFEGKTELTTAEVLLETVVRTHQDRMFGHLYLGQTVVLYQGVGRVRAGIDLDQLEVKSVDRANGQIHILLPPPYLVQADLDVDESGILEHHRNWFAPNVEAQLYTEAQQTALLQIREQACQDGLLQKADQEAEMIVRNILQAAEYQEITIESQLARSPSCLMNAGR